MTPEPASNNVIKRKTWMDDPPVVKDTPKDDSEVPETPPDA